MNPVNCLCDPWEACGFLPTSNADFVPDTNSDASVRFRTLPSDFERYRPIPNASVGGHRRIPEAIFRIRRICPILDTIV